MGIGTLVLATAMSVSGIDERCEVSECLKQLTSRVAVTVANVSASEVIGVWETGGGLSGSRLYLFSGGAYIYTHEARYPELGAADGKGCASGSQQP